MASHTSEGSLDSDVDEHDASNAQEMLDAERTLIAKETNNDKETDNDEATNEATAVGGINGTSGADVIGDAKAMDDAEGTDAAEMESTDGMDAASISDIGKALEGLDETDDAKKPTNNNEVFKDISLNKVRKMIKKTKMAEKDRRDRANETHDAAAEKGSKKTSGIKDPRCPVEILKAKKKGHASNINSPVGKDKANGLTSSEAKARKGKKRPKPKHRVEKTTNNIIERQPVARYKLGFLVPPYALDVVKDAVFKAGAGEYPHFQEACFQSEGTLQYRPIEGERPGSLAHLYEFEEVKVETICCGRYNAAQAVAALKRSDLIASSVEY